MRSALYVPGDRPEKLAGSLTRGADALIADLEDAVAPEAKPTARRTMTAWLATLPQDAPEIWIRINPGKAGHEDLHALEPGLHAVTGICVAKTETPDDLAAIDDLLPPQIALCPVLESATAVLGAPEIAQAARVVRLQLGEADLCADIGVDPGADERELLWPRSQIVLASAAAGIDPPLGPVSTDFRDLDRLAESTRALRRLGFQGRACIHPAQLPVVNEVFTPSPDELAQARALVARFEAAGSGVVVDESGRMVDEAVIRRARRTLAQGKVAQ
ncbi:HpcH/HpaI aldolase/citrate lyase family protein [Actinomadura sp. 1N219]|uniref:HpcH/HpaI aldolase/citrate lyase family protein n=1 Tax=Actinomadura sp. 1N219 TaxID=3375152 RepID=UPI003790905F